MPYNLRARKPPASQEEPKKKVVAAEPPKRKKPASETTKRKAPVSKPAKEEKATPELPEDKKLTPEPAKEKKPEPEAPKEKKSASEAAKEKRLAAKAAKEKKPTPEPVEEETPIVEPPKKKIKESPSAQNFLVFGTDSCGELGFKKIGITKKNPAHVPLDKKIKQVACGPMHTVALTESGEVYTFGCNDEGALGRLTDGDETLEATPTVVTLDAKVTKVTAGDSHTAALTDDNRVFVWGNFRDEHGSVGLTPDCGGELSLKPIQLLAEKKLTDLASGSNHMLLLDAEGVVYSFGVGAQGQLGRLKSEDAGEDNEAHKITPENREVYLNPQPVNLKNVDPQRPFICDAIYAGNFSSFATNTDKKKNRLAGWGLNNYFQLGYKGQKGQLVQHTPKRSTFTCSTSMINVACGQHHTLFLTKSGRVYVAGRHEYGMLGLGKIDKEVCPAKHITDLGNSITTISAGINTSFAVSDEGKLYSWGMNGASLGVDVEEDLIVPTEVKSLADRRVASVSAGGSFTAVLIAAN